jgi:hypothetical protein
MNSGFTNPVTHQFSGTESESVEKVHNRKEVDKDLNWESFDRGPLSAPTTRAVEITLLSSQLHPAFKTLVLHDDLKSKPGC